MYWSRTSFIILISLVFLSLSCTSPDQKKDSNYIVCTTGMIADAVQNIVGKKATVEALMGPGVDPHLYKATQGDLKKLQQADIIVYNGLFLEGKMGDILEKMQRKKTVIAMAESLPQHLFINNTEFMGAYDPHIWFDVNLWKKAIETISPKLMEIDEENRELFEANTKKYTAQLDSLHQQVQMQINQIPKKKRVLVTAHDAFSYFGQAYGIEVKGLQGISTLSEYGLRDVSNLVDFIVSQKIPAIYTETSVSKKAITAVLEGCRSKGHYVVIGGSLYSDAMGKEGSIEGTYLGMVNANVRKIVDGLSKDIKANQK